MIDQYFTGQGEVMVALLDIATGLPTGFMPLGNCSSLQLKLGLHPAQYATGGTSAASKKRASDPPQYTIGMENLSAQNLSLALHGSSLVVAAASVSNEVITAFIGKVTPLNHPKVSAFVLKNSAGTTTYVENVDYTVAYDAGSFTTLVGGAITDLQSLKVSYSHAKYEKIGTYTTAPSFLWLRFEGLNSWDQNSPVIVDIFRSKIFPIDNTDLIGDQLVKLDVRGRIFRDRTQPTTTLADSQFIRIRRVPTTL